MTTPVLDTPCPNCDTPAVGRYCHACGQDNGRGRLDARLITRDLIQNFFGWDAALGRTLKGLATSPGNLVRQFITGSRRRFVNPARFCLLSLALWFLATRLMGIDPLDASGLEITASSGGDAAKMVEKVKVFLGRHLDVLMFLSLPIRALLLRFFFRRSGMNFAECLVLVLYIGGVGYLFGAMLTPAYSPERSWIVRLRPALGLIWSYWAALGFFGYPWFQTFWRVLVVAALHTLGTIVFFGLVSVGGILLFDL